MLGLSYVMVIMWFIVVFYILSSRKIGHFFDGTSLSMQMLRKTTFEFTVDDIAQDFPLRTNVNEKPLLIIARATGEERWDKSTHASIFSKELFDAVKPCDWTCSDTDCLSTSMDGYYLSSTDNEQAKYLSSDNRIAVIAVNLCKHTQSRENPLQEALTRVNTVINQYPLKDSFPFELHTFHEDILLDESASDSNWNSLHFISIPIGLLILAYYAGPISLGILLTVPTSFFVTFAILDDIQNGNYAFTAFLPPIFMALIVATTLHYTLFILTRFQEEYRNHPLDDAIIRTLSGAGWTICTSSTLLAIVFLTVCLCESGHGQLLLWCLGIGGLVSVLTTCVVSLTLLPSIMMILGVHFPTVLNPCCELKVFNILGRITESRYFNLGQSRPHQLLGCTLLLTAPMVVLVAFGRVTSDQMAVLSANAPSMVPYRILQESNFRLGIISATLASRKVNTTGPDPFGMTPGPNPEPVDMPVAYLKSLVEIYNKGSASIVQDCKALNWCEHGIPLPIKLSDLSHELIDRACPSTCIKVDLHRDGVLTEEYFNLTRWAVDIFRKNQHPQEDWRDIHSIAHNPETNEPLNLTTAIRFLKGDINKTTELSVAEAYRLRYFRATSGLGNSALIFMRLPYDPFGGENELWLKRVVPAVKPMEVFSAAGPRMNHVINIIATIPKLLSLALLFLLIATVFFFRSLILPFRLIFTLVFTLMWTFGLSVLFFQVLAKFKGVHWVLLPGAAPIIMGVTLDYDCFLIARVIELRLQGFSTKASLRRASEKTQKTLCLAGILMTCAFSSLLFSQIWVLKQFGFVLVAGTILDTFFVRPLLVPAFMLVIGEEINWWPRRMPPISDNENTIFDNSFDNDRIATFLVDEEAGMSDHGSEEVQIVNLWGGGLDSSSQVSETPVSALRSASMSPQGTYSRFDDQTDGKRDMKQKNAYFDNSHINRDETNFSSTIIAPNKILPTGGKSVGSHSTVIKSEYDDIPRIIRDDDADQDHPRGFSIRNNMNEESESSGGSVEMMETSGGTMKKITKKISSSKKKQNEASSHLIARDKDTGVDPKYSFGVSSSASRGLVLPTSASPVSFMVPTISVATYGEDDDEEDRARIIGYPHDNVESPRGENNNNDNNRNNNRRGEDVDVMQPTDSGGVTVEEVEVDERTIDDDRRGSGERGEGRRKGSDQSGREPPRMDPLGVREKISGEDEDNFVSADDSMDAAKDDKNDVDTGAYDGHQENTSNSKGKDKGKGKKGYHKKKGKGKGKGY